MLTEHNMFTRQKIIITYRKHIFSPDYNTMHDCLCREIRKGVQTDSIYYLASVSVNLKRSILKLEHNLYPEHCKSPIKFK